MQERAQDVMAFDLCPEQRRRAYCLPPTPYLSILIANWLRDVWLLPLILTTYYLCSMYGWLDGSDWVVGLNPADLVFLLCYRQVLLAICQPSVDLLGRQLYAATIAFPEISCLNLLALLRDDAIPYHVLDPCENAGPPPLFYRRALAAGIRPGFEPTRRRRFERVAREDSDSQPSLESSWIAETDTESFNSEDSLRTEAEDDGASSEDSWEPEDGEAEAEADDGEVEYEVYQDEIREDDFEERAYPPHIIDRGEYRSEDEFEEDVLPPYFRVHQEGAGHSDPSDPMGSRTTTEVCRSSAPLTCRCNHHFTKAPTGIVQQWLDGNPISEAIRPGRDLQNQERGRLWKGPPRSAPIPIPMTVNYRYNNITYQFTPMRFGCCWNVAPDMNSSPPGDISTQEEELSDASLGLTQCSAVQRSLPLATALRKEEDPTASTGCVVQYSAVQSSPGQSITQTRKTRPPKPPRTAKNEKRS